MVRKLIIETKSHKETIEKLNDYWLEIVNHKTRFCDAEHCRFIKKYLSDNLSDGYLLLFYRNLHTFDDKFNIQINLITKVLKNIFREKNIDIIKTELAFRQPKEE